MDLKKAILELLDPALVPKFRYRLNSSVLLAEDEKEVLFERLSEVAALDH